MPLAVTLRPLSDAPTPPGGASFRATFTNTGPEPVRLNVHQASHPALALEVLDAEGRPVLLPPPGAPDERDLAPGEPIAPGQTVEIEYSGFLGRSRPAGEYRIRYASPYEPLGGTSDAPLESEWVPFVLAATDFPSGKPLSATRPAPALMTRLIALPNIGWLVRLICLLLCSIRRLIAWLRREPWCSRVLEVEIDEERTETISDAPAGAEAWNGDYAWRATFNLRVDEVACAATVTVRIRLNGNITDAQRTAWETAIEGCWNNRFKLCCGCYCCCPDGYSIVADVEFVNSDEHQVVNVGDSTTNMGNWGRDDTVDVCHEFGHMLGALDEYFTVNGVDWGAGRQPDGAIMNNPANPPAARNYGLIEQAAEDLLGRGCSTVLAGTSCW